MQMWVWEVSRAAICKLDTWKSQCVVQSESEGLRARGADGWVCVPKGRRRPMSQLMQLRQSLRHRRNGFSLLLPFALFRLSTDGMIPPHTGEDNLLSSVYWFNATLRQKLCPRHTQKEGLTQLSRQSRWHTKLTITSPPLSNRHPCIFP